MSGPGSPDGVPAGTLAGVGDAYDAAAQPWADGPATVYAHLARAMLAVAPVAVAGARVLDVGAGTGVAGRAALAAGAAGVVAVDLAPGMLARIGAPIRAVRADAAALPLADASVDLVIAACCLGHVPQPARALRESRRVAGAIVASAFTPGWTHPAKAAVDDALRPFGFEPPSWYVALKREVEPLVDDPRRLSALAARAGYENVRVHAITVDTGLRTPEALARWRLGMAHLAPFLNTLTPARRRDARRAAEAAVTGAPPLAVPLLVLAAS